MKKKPVLTQEQLVAVRSKRQFVAVVTGPGSGKTLMITERVKRLVRHCGVAPHAILVMAFGRDASAEIEQRFATVGLTGVRVSTIHALAYQVAFNLHPNAAAGSSPIATGKLLRQLKSDMRELTADFDEVKSVLSFCRNTGKSIPAVIVKRFRHLARFTAQLIKLADMYKREKQKLGLWDFDDLIVMATEKLRSSASLQGFMLALNILVDEYQDLTLAQRRFISALVKVSGTKRCSLFVVGDPAQSIYGFRGAEPDWPAKFKKRWPSAYRIDLTHNHRSTPEIVALASAIEEPLKLKRNLKPADSKKGVTPQLVNFLNKAAEAEGVAQWIVSLIGKGHKDEAIAVLGRHKADLLEIRKALESNRVSLSVTFEESLLNCEHVLDVLAAIEVGQGSRDEELISRCLMLYSGMRRGRALKLAQKIAGLGPKTPLTKAITKCAPASFHGFHALAESLICASRRETTLKGKINCVAQKLSFLLAEKYKRSWNKLKADIDRLSHIAAVGSLEQLQSKLEATDAQFAVERPKSQTGVTLSTIHGSKGLQWKIVFIVG